MRINLLSVPQPFRLEIARELDMMHAYQLNGNVVIECSVPGEIADWIGKGCNAMCSIAEGQFVIHEKL